MISQNLVPGWVFEAPRIPDFVKSMHTYVLVVLASQPRASTDLHPHLDPHLHLCLHLHMHTPYAFKSSMWVDIDVYVCADAYVDPGCSFRAR